MKLLLHICCAPCAIYPLDFMSQEGIDAMGFFYRHNIHPYTECAKREETLAAYAGRTGLRVIYQEGYDLENFLRSIVFRESDRCRFCYHERLTTTAKLARRGKFDAFSTTLLCSKFQKHDLIADIGASVGKAVGVPFYYRDFREGWKKGVQASKAMGMYRQPYCGCIYSEKERLYPNSPKPTD